MGEKQFTPKGLQQLAEAVKPLPGDGHLMGRRIDLKRAILEVAPQRCAPLANAAAGRAQLARPCKPILGRHPERIGHPSVI